MDISIGSSSSSYSSEHSECFPGSTHRSPRHLPSSHTAAESEAALGQRIALNERQPLDTEGNAMEALYESRYPDEPFNTNGRHQRGTEAPDVSSAAAFSAPRCSEEVFYTLPSRDSVSPHYTPSNSLPYSHSSTSSVPPPPLPPSPRATGYTFEKPFGLAVSPRMDVAAATSTSKVVLAEKDVGRLSMPDQPVDLSTPPGSPLQPSTGSRSPFNAFARTESPSPLRKIGADASSAATSSAGFIKSVEAGGGAGAVHFSSEEKTIARSGSRFQPWNISALKSLVDPIGDSGSAVGEDPGERQGLRKTTEGASGGPNCCATSGAEAAEARAAGPAVPPLPRPTMAIPAEAAIATSAAPQSSSRSPSFSRAGEPRAPLGQVTEDATVHAEESSSWRDNAERAESVSATDYGARPPSHAPMMDPYTVAAASANSGEESRRWQQSRTSASYNRSCSKSDNASCGGKRHSSNAPKCDRVGPAAREEGEPRQQDQGGHSVSLTRVASSPSPSVRSPSVGEKPCFPSQKDAVEPAIESRKPPANFTMEDAHWRLNHTGNAGQDDVVTEVSSIAFDTPADTTLSGSTGRQKSNHITSSHDEGDNQATGAVAAMSGTVTLDESPSPLPPALWKGGAPTATTTAGSAEEHLAVDCSVRLYNTPQDSKAEASAESRDARHSSGHHVCEQSALDRWRSRATDSKSKEKLSTLGSRSLSGTANAGGPGGTAAHSNHNADMYKGGVNFVRWVPTSVGRDADLSRVPYTPPRRPREVHTDDSSGLRGKVDAEGIVLSSDDVVGGGTVQVVAVPMVPSPHRQLHQISTTPAVLGGVAHRRGSAAQVPEGGRLALQQTFPSQRMVPATSSTSSRQRMRLLTITSPQLTRSVNRVERSYVDRQRKQSNQDSRRLHPADARTGVKCNSASSAFVSLQADGDTYEAPMDAWVQQKSGRFLSCASLSDQNKRSFPSGTWQSVGAQRSVTNCSEGEPSSTGFHYFPRRGRLDVEPMKHQGVGHMPSELDAAITSRSTSLRSFSDVHPRVVRVDDDSSDLPAVVRAWKPLSAVVNSSPLLHQRTPHASCFEEEGNELGTPMSRWTHEASALAAAMRDKVKQPPSTASMALALSIDVSDTSHASSPDLNVAQTRSSSVKKGNFSEDLQRGESHTDLNNGTITPGYMALYSPRTLSTEVLQARGALLLRIGPQASPHANDISFKGISSPRNNATNRLDAAPESVYYPHQTAVGSFASPRVSAGSVGGSRVMPAVGAAMSVTTSIGSFHDPPLEMAQPPPPLHLRVDLSRTPLRVPPVAEVLSSSYGERAVTATFVDEQLQPVGALACRQGEKVAAALAAEPLSFFLVRDSGYVEADTLTKRELRAALRWQQREPQEKVARRIPFGPSVGAAYVSDRNTGGNSLLPASEQCHSTAPVAVSRNGAQQSMHGRCESHDVKEDSEYDAQYNPRVSRHGPALEALRRMDERFEHRGRGGECTHLTGSAHSLAHHSYSAEGSSPVVSAPSCPASPLQHSESGRSTMETSSVSYPIPNSVSTAEADRPSSISLVRRISTSSTLKGAVKCASQPTGDRGNLHRLTELNIRHTHTLEQQRLIQEEAFRRRQTVMQEDHSFFIEMTELHYRCAVAYIQRAADTAVFALPSVSSLHSEHQVGSTEGHRYPEPGHLVGLLAIRRDQAAMAASVGKLSNDLSILPLEDGRWQE
ncbi:5'a2rel-related protein [Leptomonas seymouri]|uniref:5'a2rel-related protein n=1 Tax=Leptomonas seymouri TaxID=5684 RepID=A0A0N0P6L9_LEPSE|nr:5'a2rel-related protein [Leptomonas seymouri]|eukprot:KPI87769.1 5'a2rel-related protein [Leptomonas seymouri]